MSSEEDFSLVEEAEPSGDTLEGVQVLIRNCKEKHTELLKDQDELISCTEELKRTAQKYRNRSDKVTQALVEDQLHHHKTMVAEKEKMNSLHQEMCQLKTQIQDMRAALQQEESVCTQLRNQTSVLAQTPKKEVVFKGQVGKVGSTAFEIKTHVEYPMEGGTALITFDEEDVAKRVLSMQRHRVDLEGECSIMVEVRPVQLMMLKRVEISLEVCPQSILISDLPRMDARTLKDGLHIHFSRSKHGGGEVDRCEWLSDSGTVVLSFLNNNLAEGLAETQYHDVVLQDEAHTVRVTPFLNGTITKLETAMSVCPRSLLLTGIPAVMEQENLQELLYIHFQKSINNGGEISSILYNPLGHRTSALFKVCSDPGNLESVCL